jgi:kinesin family protein 5
MKETLIQLTMMKEKTHLPITEEEIKAQHMEMMELKTVLAQKEALIADLTKKALEKDAENLLLKQGKDNLKDALKNIEMEYDELLERSIREEDEHGNGQELSDLKTKLEHVYQIKTETMEKEMSVLKEMLEKKESLKSQQPTEVFHHLTFTF